MENRGHNENAVRLAALAGDAQIALDRVARGEQDALEGWIAYGAALNEGRALFPGDREFGQWVASACFDNLSVRPNEHEQVAAMWAAANLDQFHEARAAGSARTVRGIHAKWKEIEAQREKERIEAEVKAKAERAAQAGEAQPDGDGTCPTAPEAVKATHDAVKNESAPKEADPSAAPAKAVAAPDVVPGADDIDAEARREWSALTSDGREEVWIEKCRIISELCVERDEARQERDALKATLADMQSDDKDLLIRKLNEELSAAKYRRDQAMSDCKAEEYRRRKLQKRVDELQKMEIVL